MNDQLQKRFLSFMAEKITEFVAQEIAADIDKQQTLSRELKMTEVLRLSDLVRRASPQQLHDALHDRDANDRDTIVTCCCYPAKGEYDINIKMLPREEVQDANEA